jgi:ankyrin repeat protein
MALQVHPITSLVESACDFTLQRLKLEHDELLSNIAFKFDLRRYSTVDGGTPLFVAAYQGHVDVVERLLAARGADVNLARTIDGVTPLSIAAYQGQVDVVERLVAASGVDVNKVSTAGSPPMYIAAQQGHADVVVRRCRVNR